MDQRRFEQTFRQIVTKLNGLGRDEKTPGGLRPAPVVNDPPRDAQGARPQHDRR